MSDLDSIKDKSITLAIVRNGKHKKDEQYKRDGDSWVLCEIDWGDIYSEFMAHYHMSPESVDDCSLPFIEAIRARLGKHISLKIGMPIGGIEGPVAPMDNPLDAHVLNKPGEIPCIDDIIGFCSGFNGAGG